MIRRKLFGRRPRDPELEQAKRMTAQSKLRSQREYRTSVDRLADTQQVAQQLRVHNDANRYTDWLERRFLGTSP